MEEALEKLKNMKLRRHSGESSEEEEVTAREWDEGKISLTLGG